MNRMLAGEVAVITGAARSIGRALALSMAQASARRLGPPFRSKAAFCYSDKHDADVKPVPSFRSAYHMFESGRIGPAFPTLTT